ncbi:MAG: glucose-1-phosphate thymidylyltransferase RfbA [Oscillospiraceae bacterium]
MKGIILAAGKGSRLYPLTLGVPKPLLPLYDKPMIYYSLAVLMMADIKDVMIIVSPKDLAAFKNQLGNGSDFGINISYAIQEVPKGIADAFIIAEDFIANDRVCLALGDNIFIAKNLSDYIKRATQATHGAKVFALPVINPEAFGVVEFDSLGKVISIEEKPQNPKSNSIIPGVYFYDNNVVKIAKALKPSARGELEITDINRKYLEINDISVVSLPNEMIWFDCGTYNSLLEAANGVAAYQSINKEQICCPEQIAYEKGYITRQQLDAHAESMKGTAYGKWLMELR